MTTQAFIVRYGLQVNTNLLVVNTTSNSVGVNTASPAVSFHIAANDAIKIPIGNTGQRPTGAPAYLRYNSDSNTFEGFANGNWGPIGGGVTPAGANGYIQFNNNAILGASANLQFNNNILNVPEIIAPSPLDLQILSSNATAANIGGIIVSNAGFVSIIGNSSVNVAQADATGYKVAKQRIQELGSLSTLAPDLANGNIFEFTLSANATINAPVNFQPGFYTFIVHNGLFFITTWNVAFKWPGATAPQSTASGTDVFSFVSNGTAMMGSMVPGLG